MKLFLIDGHALIFKMYYAFLGRPMINGKGQDTSILFGFTKYLMEMIEREKPTHLAVSFDPPGGTFRNQMYPAYKANRAETPQLVIDALEPLTAIVESLGIPVMMMPGFEADDVIGSAAKQFAPKGYEVYMVTPDKDYGQLVEPGIWQYRPAKSGGEAEILGPSQICEKYGIASPQQVIDVLALCGDSADNVPGVPGVGPVGAGKLLGKYGSLESIYEHIGELTEKQRANFEAARDYIDLSKQLVTIKTDIALPVEPEAMALRPFDSPKAAELFAFYEFHSLKKYLSAKAPAGAQASAPAESSAPKSEKVALEKLAGLASKSKRLALVATEDNLTLAVGETFCQCSAEEAKGLLEDPLIEKCMHGAKAQIKLIDSRGIEMEGRIQDVELLHYVLNPERSHALDFLSQSLLGVELQTAAPQAEMSLFGDEQLSEEQNDHSLEAVCIFRLAELLRSQMDETSLRLYDTIEEPLIGVLARIEMAGVLMDVASLQDFANSLRAQMLAREKQVRELAEEPTLNVGSPKQIGEVLFEKMKLGSGKKPAKGWSTDEETLLDIDHPIIEAILDYRGTRKLLSTYIEPFPGYISPSDGRIHTTFNQALTSTGRLSSSNPNLQNIPVRTDQGREIRKAFVAPNGCVMMSADYSQIELRLMAHFCQDAQMLSAFREGRDVHSAMAAKIFHKPLEEVTSSDRRVAKTANFGIMYGISAHGLSQRLKCPRKEAQQIIEDYYAQFPLIKSFIDATLLFARENNYVETLFGRRRYVSDVNSHNGNLRAIAERNAVNAPIQGTAADIMKLAMIAVDRALREGGYKARVVLQIHDELVLEVPDNEIIEVQALLTSQMENVAELSVPLTVECNYGKNWLEAH